MAAITVADLNNAKVDVDLIAAFADSPAPTAVTRQGDTIRTLAGLTAEFDAALDALDAEAVVTATMQNAARAEEAANVAENAAAEAGGKVYDTLAAALADGTLTAGKRFLVRQLFGPGSYNYTRTGTGAQFLEVAPYGAASSELSYKRVVARTLTPLPAGVTVHLWGSNAAEWDGRVVPNELTTTRPTLNLIPDPWNPLDELGTTPAREPNTAAVADPLGGSNALKVTSSGANQVLAVNRSSYGAVPAVDLVLRVWGNSISGSNAWRLGQTGATNITLPVGSWTPTATPHEVAISGYTNASDIGFVTAVGNTDGVAAIAGLQAFDPWAGESATLPGLQASLDAQRAGHLKASFATRGSVQFTPTWAIAMDPAARGSLMVARDPSAPTLTRYSWGGVMDATETPSGLYGHFFGVDFHSGITGGGSAPVHGQMGAYGVTSATTPTTAHRPGKGYFNPLLATYSGATDSHVVGTGKRSFVGTVDTGLVTAYLDGIPVYLGTDGGWTAPKISRWMAGAYNGSGERHKTSNALKGTGQGYMLAEGKTLTMAEVLQLDKAWRDRLRLEGDTIAPRKEAIFGASDSTTAFPPSYFHHLGDNSNFFPRLVLHMDAVGGSNIVDMLTNPRYQRLKDRIYAAYVAGFDRARVFCRSFTNEIVGPAPWGWVAMGYDWTPWLENFWKPWVQGLLDVVPAGFLEFDHLTASPRIDFDDEYLVEDMRQRWNDYCRVPANLTDAYCGAVVHKIEMGLGTERITAADGSTVPETIPGGRIMSNWRYAKASKTASRAPATGITLSAATGAAVTVSGAAAGTFTKLDVWRKLVITGSPGYGRIESVTADGTGCVVNTLDEVPTAYPGETALMTQRDSIVRGGGYSGTSAASGAWTIQGCAEKLGSDGIHQLNPGGRDEADYYAPTIQARQNLYTGAALR